MDRKFWQRSPFILIFFLIILSSLIFLQTTHQGPFQEKKTEPPKEEVQVEENIVSASGKVEAKNIANLTFQTAGLVTFVGVKEGDSVRKSQIIARLDTRQLQKSLDRQLNLYMTNRWDFEQTKDDFKEKRENFLLTDADRRILDKTQFSLNNAVIDVETIDIALKLSTITTPISGIVVEAKPAMAGVNTSPGNSNFTIVDPNSTVFVANVDEADIGKVKIGQAAQISLDSFPDEKIGGKVTKIGFISTSTAGGGTAFRVEVSLPSNDDLKFKVGMNGDADIQI